MIQGLPKLGARALSQSGPHDEFLELCAVSTSGELTDDEQKRLREHLAICASCREALRQYESIVSDVIPAISIRKWNSMTNHSRSRNPDLGISTTQLTKSWLNWTCRRCSAPYRTTNRRLFGCTSSKAIRWMRLQKCLVRPRATSDTTHSAGWNGCGNRFFVANCQVREQYDTRFA